MQRTPRDPDKFDAIDLFDALARKHDFKMGDESSQREFICRVSHIVLNYVGVSNVTNQTETGLYSLEGLGQGLQVEERELETKRVQSSVDEMTASATLSKNLPLQE